MELKIVTGAHATEIVNAAIRCPDTGELTCDDGRVLEIREWRPVARFDDCVIVTIEAIVKVPMADE